MQKESTLIKKLPVETFVINMYVHSWASFNNLEPDLYDSFYFKKNKYLKFALGLLVMDDCCYLKDKHSIKDNEFRFSTSSAEEEKKTIGKLFTYEFTIHQHTRLKFAEREAKKGVKLTAEYIDDTIRNFQIAQNIRSPFDLLRGAYENYFNHGTLPEKRHLVELFNRIMND